MHGLFEAPRITEKSTCISLYAEHASCMCEAGTGHAKQWTEESVLRVYEKMLQ